MVKVIVKVLLILGVITGVLSAGILTYIFVETPALNYNKKLNESTKVFDKNGLLLDEIHGEEHRIIVDIKDIDPDIQEAVIAIEDNNFYKHSGVSVRGVARAVTKATKDSIAAGKLTASEGASTIPMQLAKNLNGNVEDRTVFNKLVETIQAIKISRQYSKEDILEKYLNVIYWGNNTYGIETATNTYFGKSANDVEIHEAAMLAALIQNPSKFNPYGGNYKALKNRQKEVLRVMGRNRCTKPEIEQELLNACIENFVNLHASERLLVSGKTTWQKSLAPFVTDSAVKEAKETLSLTTEDIETGGYRIYTTVSLSNQQKALAAVDMNKGWKGEAQIALVSIDVNTNKIVATVGSKDYNVSPLNRSIESYRQPGSANKPFVYYTAFAMGYSPEDIIDDSPYCPVKGNRWSKAYCPKNYGGDFLGPGTIRDYLKKSRNVPAVKIGQRIGIRNVIRVMEDLGITTKLEPTPSFPLGSNDLKPVEVANAYAAFANGGKYHKYTILEKVETTTGKTLVNHEVVKQKKVLDRSATKKLDSVLRDVVTSGTGTQANVPGVNTRGKTGTTDSAADVWFIGYDDNISTAVWIGNDNYHRKLYGGATGGGWAAPIYRDWTYKYYN